MLPRASASRKYFRITSSWSAAGCAKRSPGRRRKDLRPLLRKLRDPLPHEPQKPLLHNPRNPLPREPHNRLLHESEDPLVDKMTAIRTYDFQMMSPSLIHGAPEDHL